ncbi:MAG TPA: hypothetical protein VNK43_13040 [Gemmatimonadales bacterium]|nr:hypothetical protein [Gemmatimonadales bacterium]
MILTIHLERVLRDAVGAEFTHLVTRPTGAAVRGGIRSELARAECGTLLLDFSRVGLIDFSCADEIVAKLLLDAELSGGRYLVLYGLSDDHAEAIDHILVRQGLAVAAIAEDGAPRLLGEIPPDARAAFDALQGLGPLDPPRLADALGWTVDRADAALRALAARRLARPDVAAYHSILPAP